MESADYLLTLKNLYRMLTKLDYMSHSYPPLPQAGMKGQTVVKFWHELFSRGLPKGTDLGVFESDGTRSRSLAKLLNRSGTTGLMEKWFRLLSESLGAELLLEMTRAWLRTFSEYGCNIDALKGRMEVFLNALLSANELETVENRLLIEKLKEMLKEETGAPIQFRLSLILGSLSICALYGNRLRDPALGRIKMVVDLGGAELYKLSLLRNERAEPTICSSQHILDT